MKFLEFQKIGDILSRDHKIHIKPGNSWAANIKSRDIFYKKNDIYTLPENHILGLLLHEVAHIHYTSETPAPKENKELTQSALNMVEDVSIEHIIGQDYPNAGEILEETKKELLDTLIIKLTKMKIPIHEKALLYGATKFEGRGYAFGTEKYEIVGDEISQLMKKNEALIYGRKQTKELLPLIKEIVDILIKKLGKPTDKDLDQMRESPMHGFAREGDKDHEAKRGVINALKGGHGWQEGAEVSMKVEFIDAIADQAVPIGKKLRTILKRNNAMEFGGRYRTGKLKAKRIIRIKIVKDRKPFARRIIKSNQSYAFAVAADVSGSMFNSNSRERNNADYALSSLQMVGEALRIAGVPRAMLVFGVRAKVAAPMGKLPIKWETLANDRIINTCHQSGTCVDEAIRGCIKELDKVRAERKIMIILTDGQSDWTPMKEAHKEAKNQGIECLGITIGDESNNIEEIFGKNFNRNIKDANDSAKVGKAFIEILQSTIKNSP